MRFEGCRAGGLGAEKMRCGMIRQFRGWVEGTCESLAKPNDITDVAEVAETVSSPPCPPTALLEVIDVGGAGEASPQSPVEPDPSLVAKVAR